MLFKDTIGDKQAQYSTTAATTTTTITQQDQRQQAAAATTTTAATSTISTHLEILPSDKLGVHHVGLLEERLPQLALIHPKPPRDLRQIPHRLHRALTKRTPDTRKKGAGEAREAETAERR